MMHTPGPWKVSGNGAQVDADTEDYLGRRSYRPTIARCTIASGNWTYETVRANARLIAAAPTLLDALVEMLDYHGTMPTIELGEAPCECEFCEQARAAIDQAKEVKEDKRPEECTL